MCTFVPVRRTVAESVHIPLKVSKIRHILQRILNIFAQHFSVRKLTALLEPIVFLLTAVKRSVLQNGFSMFSANGIGHFAQFHMVADFVAVFLSVLERGGVNYKMVVQIIGIEVCGDKYLKPVTPHSSRRFFPDFVCFFGRNLSHFKTLITVISNNLAAFMKLSLHRTHFFIGAVLGTVDTGNIHLFIGFTAVFGIGNSGTQVII